ncbi:T9SS type A sorting domain-containing protein [Aestuariibaculum suncheonense]|uniref:T9SS type A sorting domain-containing protein n=1 Tax=Aestuariibaculum suncheonense TaxID=1028745 RepID=A0A8J6UHA8_9FLAO|nr:T9SS type A sorting domain-containing protein [Aestuariibaculum suncheonense]MBD0835679.1 T9SS type A sorting domain-containing protein [Aestuariibaculum suncheonense]
MKKITKQLFILMLLSVSAKEYAQTANATGLPGDDLIFYEDMRYATGASGFTVTTTEATLTPSGNSSIPVDGLSAGEIGYIRPDNNYPAGDARDNRSLRIQANDGSTNYATDVWIVVNSIDLSAYDSGSKFFTFSTRTTFREDGGSNLDTDTSVLYATDFVTGTDPTTVTWTPITTSPVADSAEMGADGVWTTQSVDLSEITCGTQFAIAIRRQSSLNGPTGGVFDSATNRNGTFNISDLTYTGSTTPLLSINNSFLVEGISVYPNPVKSQLNIKSLNPNITIKNVQLIDITGKTVYNKDFSELINVSQFSKGLYILKLKDKNGDLLIKKIVLN